VTEHLCTNGQQSTYTILKERVLGFGPSPSSYLQSCQRRTSQRRVPLILVAGSESNDGGPVGAAPHPHGHAPAGGGRCRTSGNRFGNEGLRTAPCVAELSSMGSSSPVRTRGRKLSRLSYSLPGRAEPAGCARPGGRARAGARPGARDCQQAQNGDVVIPFRHQNWPLLPAWPLLPLADPPISPGRRSWSATRRDRASRRRGFMMPLPIPSTPG
jgi:hypothetical protein